MKGARSIVAALAFGAAAGSACSSGVNAVQMQPSRPGALQFRVECAKNVSRCRDKALEVCGGEYEILQSSGRAVEPERITTAPGPVSTGPNFAPPTWQGELIVECGRRHAEPQQPVSGEPPAPAASAPIEASVALGPGQVCVPGVTQLCLGPAACRGAQSCLADGKGFGACDCGNASSTSPAASGSALSAPDAGAPAPNVQ
jgi:hypothetical protein